MKKKVAIYGGLIALAFLVSFIETFIPLPIAIPGMKLGLTNIIIIYVLYTMGIKDAYGISIARVILCGFLFGNMAGILYSLSGAVISLGIMALLKKRKAFSIVGVSVCGGVAHNTGQIIVAAFVTSWKTVLFYFPFLLIAGVFTGIVIGILGKEMIRRIPRGI